MFPVTDAERQAALMYLPPVFYVPTARLNGPDGPEIELRHVDDNEIALMVYTARDRLHRCCGDFQRWAMVPAENLKELHRRLPFDKILTDVEIPEELRYDLEDLL